MTSSTSQAPKNRGQRKPKTELESKIFRDGAIYLFRRADYKKPTWFCRIKIPHTKGYISQSTKTTDEHLAFKFADDVYLKALAEVASGRDLNSKKVTAAIEDFIKSYSENEKKKPTAITRAKFLTHISTYFGNKRLKEINTKVLAELNDWIIENSRTGSLSVNTLKRYTTDLKQFLNWCYDRSYIDTLPRFPKLKTESNRRPHFDDKDWSKLTRHLREFIKSPKASRDRNMLRDYVLILANTGIRVGEARNLKWKDLREIPNELDDTEPANIALSVSGKTGARIVIARTAEVRTYFKRLLDLRTEELGKKPNNEDYIFCNRDGSPVGSFKKSFISLIKSAGVEFDENGNKRTIYSLRHTYATFRLGEGVHQFVLAQNMGTSVSMLEKHYGHTSNIASVAELTKGGSKKSTTIEWLADKDDEP